MTSSYSGVTSGGSALNYDPTPQYSPLIDKANQVVQRDINLLNESINANNQTNIINAQNAGSDLKALGKLAGSITDFLVEEQKKKNEKEKLKGILDAWEEGDEDTEETDRQEEEYRQQEREFNRSARDRDPASVERVRNQSEWYQYGRTIGHVQRKSSEYGTYIEDAKQTSPTITVGGEEIHYDSPDRSQRAAWMSYHRTQFLKQFGDFKDREKILIKHLFPAMRTYENADEKLWLTQNRQMLLAKRTQEAKQTLLQGLNGSTPGESFLQSVQSGVLTRKEIGDELKFLAENKLLQPAVLAKLRQHKFVHKGTGKETTIGAEFARELAPVDVALRNVEKKDYDFRVYQDKKDKKLAEQRFIESFVADPDGVTKDNIEDAQNALIRAGLGRSEILDDFARSLSVDALERQKVFDRAQGLVDAGLFRKEDLQYYPADVKARIAPQISSAAYQARQKNADKYNNLVSDMVKGLVTFRADKSYNWTVGAKVIEQQGIYASNLAQARLDPTNQDPERTAFQMTQEAFESEQKRLEVERRQKGEEAALSDSYVEMYDRLGDKSHAEQARQRYSQITAALDPSNKNKFENPSAYYSVSEFNNIVKRFGERGFQYDEVANRASRILRMHPIKFYNAIGNRFKELGQIPNFEELKVPEAIGAFEQELTPAQKNLIYNLGTRQRVHRAIGGPTSWPVRGAKYQTQTPGWQKLSSAIRFGEGTLGDRGYTTMFTGAQFSDFDEHPRIINTSGPYSSDAAGAYQFLSTTYQPIADLLGLNDFSPHSQERAARHLVEEKGIDPDAPIETIEEFAQVMAALAPTWSSLPLLDGTSAHGQPVKTIEELWQIYQSN